MEAWQITIEILVLLAAALLMGTVAEQLRVSSVLGYLVAGTLVGPNVLELVRTRESVDVIAELGAALLLFTIGLEFSLRRLRRLGRIALMGGTLQVISTALLGAAVCGAMGLPLRGAVALGAMLALSSTACVVRLLMDRASLESVYGRSALAILLLQDAAVIPLMVLLATLSRGSSPGSTAVDLLRTAAAIIVLIGAFYLIVNVLVPRLMNIKRWSANRELPILLSIVLALGSAAAAHQASLSPAMGAFLAGLLMGESPFAVQIRADIAALRAVLVTLFFASIGMLGDPAWAIAHAHWVGGAVAATIVGKTCIVWALGRMLGLSHGTAIATGLCVAQIGEFSFVLAQMAARATGPGGPMIDDDTARLIITTTIATLFLTPFLVAAAPRVSGWVDACLRRRRGGPQAPGEAPAAPPPEQPQVLLIGFGPAGQSVAEALLRQLGPRLRVIDLNPRNAAIAERYGLPVQVGDATQLEMLEHAGAERCAVIIVTIPDPEAARTVVHQCRHLAPGATIIARARYHMHRWDLELAGAATVIDEERQVGLRLAADARRHLHAAAAPPRGDRAGPEAGA